MHEADIPTNQDWNEPLNNGNSPQVEKEGLEKENLEKENCPFYSLFPNENSVIAKLAPANSSEPANFVEVASEVASEPTKANKEQWREDESSSDSMLEISSEDKTSLDSESNGILELDRAQWESIADFGISEDELASNSQQDWVAEPDIEKQLAIDAEFQQLLDLNQELRSDNSDLYQQLEELTLALTDTQKALQKQKNRSSIAESMLSQETQENTANTEKMQSLFQQLETATQTIKRQESLIESYKAHLESSQQRLAQLERECTELQSKYSEQSYQFLQSENACRELRTRLMRQQRQTLQFKAALSKCLDTPVPGELEDNQTVNGTDTCTRKSSISTNKLRSFLTNAQPIRPWSASQTESFNDDDVYQAEDLSQPSAQIWQETVSEFSGWDDTVKENIFTEKTSFFDPPFTETTDNDSAAQVYIWDTSMEEESDFSSVDETSNEISIWDIEASEEDISSEAATNFTSEITDREIPSEAVSHTESSDLDSPDLDSPDLDSFNLEESGLQEKLDSVIEMFFRTQGISQASQSEQTDDASTYRKPVWESVVTSIDADISGNENSEDKTGNLSDNLSDDLSDDSVWSGDNFDADFNSGQVNSGQFIHHTSDENSPSPVVYPERRRKPKKSFASVELPDFRSYPKAE